MTYTISPEVTKLLAQYEAYKKLQADLSRTSSLLARSKLRKLPTAELQAQHNNLTQELQQLSDEMTFDSPYTWIQYKYEAYKAEAQPILTMHDLRVHCSKPDYICTKRYTFLNSELDKLGRSSLRDTKAYPDELSLQELLASELMEKLMENSELLEKWQAHEFYKQSGRVAKWEDFSPEVY